MAIYYKHSNLCLNEAKSSLSFFSMYFVFIGMCVWQVYDHCNGRIIYHLTVHYGKIIWFYLYHHPCL